LSTPRHMAKYAKRNGKIVKIEMQGDEYHIDGKKVSPEKFFMVWNENSTRAVSLWPQKSRSMSCNPSQVAEYRKFLEGKGVPGSTVLDNGQFQFESASHKRRAIRAVQSFLPKFCDFDDYMT